MKYPKVIGEGSYGCIHRPSLTCKNKKISYREKVSKLLLNRYAIKEMKQYLRIAKADKSSHYYLGIPVECKIMNSKPNIRAINKCEKGENIANNIDDYSILVMPDGGVDIEIFAMKLKTQNKNMNIFWKEFLRMLEGCQLFLKHNIINHDIKPQNILYDESKNKMSFIDFGLMQAYSMVIAKVKQSNFWLSRHAHWSYPLEIQFLNKKKFDNFLNKSKNEKIDFYSKIIYNINNDIDTYNSNSIKTFFSYVMPKNNYKEFTNTYFNDLLNMITMDLNSKSYNEFIKKSLDTIDIYGVGFTMLYAANILKHILDKEFYNDIFNFTYKLITPRLFDRYTCEDAIIKYKELLNKHNIFKQNKHITKIKNTLHNIKSKSLIFTKKKRIQIINNKVLY